MKAATIFLAIIISFSASAQTVEDEVRAMFSDENTIEWIQHYKGRMNDINDVAITLGSDGKTCKGILWYLRSKAKFSVSGTIVNDTILELTEYDENQVATAKITGEMNPLDGINANWGTIDGTLGESLILLPTSQEPRYPGYCGDNKWIQKYTGKIGEETVEMTLRRGNNGLLKGTAYYASVNETYLIEGALADKSGSIDFVIKDLNWNEKAAVIAKVDLETNQILGKANVNDIETSCNFSMLDRLSVGCIEYADFLTKSEVTFPKTRNQNFNELIEEEIQNWLKLSRAYTKEYLETASGLTTDNRSILRSYCWYEIDYLSDNFISGKVYYTNTWDDDFKGFSFNYDLTGNRSISLQGIFKRDFNYDEFIQKYIEKEVKNRPFYGDGFYENWIKEQKFEYFNIRKEGLVFSTNFSGVYGEQQIVIPFEALIPYLRDGDIFEEIVN